MPEGKTEIPKDDVRTCEPGANTTNPCITVRPGLYPGFREVFWQLKTGD
jgi:hypothetical protein